MGIELLYGLRNNELVHIDQVPSGLDCNCVCPHCKEVLIAKKGEIKKHHFAHYQAEDCYHGNESALHIEAKRILMSIKKVYVPHIPKNIYDTVQKGQIIKFETAECEKRINDKLRSDILLTLGDRLLNVEIKVSHSIDFNKKIELFNAGLPTIEINLSDMANNFSEERITEALLSGQRTELIFSPKAKIIFAKTLLGEWKKVYRGSYVHDCPLSKDTAYFIDFPEGGRNECFACNCFNEYNGGEKLLCHGRLYNLEFHKIDKILYAKKKGKHLVYAKILLTDGTTKLY